MKPQTIVSRLAAFVGVFALCAITLSAQEIGTSVSFAAAGKEAIPINVLVGQSRVITFDGSLERFAVSNTEIAEAVLISSHQVVVNGKAFGQINLLAWEKGTGRFVAFDVYVRTNLSLIDSQMRALFPMDDIRLSQANGSVVLSGTVADVKTAERAEAVVKAAGFTTVNLLESPVKDQTQVQLQVRVAEVSRNKLRELGSSFASASNGTSVFSNGGGPANLRSHENGSLLTDFAGSALNLFLFNDGLGTAAYIRALKTTGALRSLAEPNLIAMNGQQASFLAGGEFPVPIVQGGAGSGTTVTVVFKEYGIRLNFKPTIIDEDHIRLELEPEVSTLDFANGVRFSGFVIPGLRSRRAKTGVELRDGQSFALAGLLDNSEVQSISKIPGLGDVPILGNLFKSKQFQKNETELMFIITAQLVKPVNRDDIPAMPNVDTLKQGSPLGIEKEGAKIYGKTGFSISAGEKSATVEPQPAAASPTTTTAPAGAAAASAMPPSAAAVKPSAAPAATATEASKVAPNQ
jgi:pilus assembly protein CpaC